MTRTTAPALGQLRQAAGRHKASYTGGKLCSARMRKQLLAPPLCLAPPCLSRGLLHMASRSLSLWRQWRRLQPLAVTPPPLRMASHSLSCYFGGCSGQLLTHQTQQSPNCWAKAWLSGCLDKRRSVCVCVCVSVCAMQALVGRQHKPPSSQKTTKPKKNRTDRQGTESAWRYCCWCAGAGW